MSLDPKINDVVTGDWSATETILKKWSSELYERADVHRKAANKFRTLNRILGGLNVMLAAFTATAMYAALNKKLENLSIGWQIVLTIIAVLPAIAAGLQKEWQVVTQERSHVAIAQDCRMLAKEIDFLVAFPPSNFREAITSWHQRYREVIARSVVPAQG